jgi:hypothetical protein
MELILTVNIHKYYFYILILNLVFYTIFFFIERIGQRQTYAVEFNASNRKIYVSIDIYDDNYKEPYE